MASCTNLLFLICFNLVVTVAGRLPDGYIFQITPACGTNAVEDAEINIITDLDANIAAECDGRRVPFTTSDGVHFNLQVAYPSQNKRVCVFKRKRNALAFSVKLIATFRKTGRRNRQHQEEYTVSCTFNPRNSSNSTEHYHMIEGLIAATDKEPPRDALTFDLEMVDVLGNPMEGRPVRIGRVVQMKGNITTDLKTKFGIRPVSCDAVDGEARYAVIRAGCGDGLIFPRTTGFSTSDKATVSPYFGAFRMKSNVVMKFECRFIPCRKFCYGSSCRLHRRRRGSLEETV